MAERRMFARSIVLSDNFLDLPPLARCLYFCLGMVADDDGFVNNPRSVMRQCGAAETEMDALVCADLIICFDSGVVVIKDWRICNEIKKDRYKETQYLEEKKQLRLGKNKSYIRILDCFQNGSNPDTQDRIDQDRSGEIRADEVRGSVETSNPLSADNLYGIHQNVSLTRAELAALKAEFPQDYAARIDRLSEYMASSGKVYSNHCHTIRAWARRDAIKQNIYTNDFHRMIQEELYEQN